jgi:hypothetical protein
MKHLIIAIFTLITVSGFAQKNKDLPDNFYTCWIASFEEDNQSANTQVYRHCDNRSLKPGPHRQRYDIQKDGSCKVLLLDDTGASYFIDAKWTYDKSTGVVSVTGDNQKFASKFEVLSVGNDKLVISTQK